MPLRQSGTIVDCYFQYQFGVEAHDDWIIDSEISAV